MTISRLFDALNVFGVKDERSNKWGRGVGGGLLKSKHVSRPGELKKKQKKKTQSQPTVCFKRVKFVKTNGAAICRDLLGEAPVSVGQTLVSFYNHPNRLDWLLHLLGCVWPCEETSVSSASPNRFWNDQ